jgi:hypothetical protein
MAAAQVNETQWRAQVKELAKSAGWAWYYTPYSLGATPGWPDLGLVKPPRVVLAELKTPRGRIRAGQADTAYLLERCHDLEYHLWRPDDLEDVAEVLGVTLRQGRLL